MLVFENPLKARLLGPQFLVHMLGILGYPIWVFRDEKSPIDNDDTRNTRRLQLLKVGCFYAPGTGFRWTKKKHLKIPSVADHRAIKSCRQAVLLIVVYPGLLIFQHHARRL